LQFPTSQSINQSSFISGMTEHITYLQSPCTHTSYSSINVDRKQEVVESWLLWQIHGLFFPETQMVTTCISGMFIYATIHSRFLL